MKSINSEMDKRKVHPADMIIGVDKFIIISYMREIISSKATVSMIRRVVYDELLFVFNFKDVVIKWNI